MLIEFNFMKIFMILFLVALSIRCQRTYADLSGKCEREANIQKQCLLKNLVACEIATGNQKKIDPNYIDTCTQIGGITVSILRDSCKKSDDCDSNTRRAFPFR